MKSTVIIQICGGLGNQLFQYLFGISKFNSNECNILFDVSDCMDPNNPRRFVLDQLGLPGNFLYGHRHTFERNGIEYAQLRDIKWLQRQPSIDCGVKIEGVAHREDKEGEIFFDSSPGQNHFYFGYWQSSRYWSDDLSALKLISEFALKLIKSTKGLILDGDQIDIDQLTCAVHVRGGDYLEFLDYHGVCQSEYYKSGFSKFPNHKFHIYTNDLEYAKKIIPQSSNVIYIANFIQDDLLEFALLTTYSKYIIPNSSYSYLASMVGRSSRGSQQVIAPYPWYSFDKHGPDFPEDWLKLNRASGNTVNEDLEFINHSKISVIMPVYRRHEFLEEALKSALNQTRTPDEILISQNAASDEVIEEVRRLSKKYPNIKVVNSITPNSLSHARNIAIKEANGDFIAILDDDDIWVENKLELQLRNLVLLGATVCASNFHEINMDGDFQWASKYSSVREASWIKLLTYENSFSGGSAAMIRRDVFDRVGMFDINLPSCEDHDMWRRMAIAGERLIFLEDDLIGIRKAGGNMSGNVQLRIRGELIHLSKMINEPLSPVEAVNAYYRNVRSALDSLLYHWEEASKGGNQTEEGVDLISPGAKTPFFKAVLKYHHLSILKANFINLKNLWIKAEREEYLRLDLKDKQSFSSYLSGKYVALPLLIPVEAALFLVHKVISKFQRISR